MTLLNELLNSMDSTREAWDQTAGELDDLTATMMEENERMLQQAGMISTEYTEEV